MLLFVVNRDLSIVNFHDFPGTFSLKILFFERSEYINLEGTLVIYNVIQISVWAV
jgi:hypothetical protein